LGVFRTSVSVGVSATIANLMTGDKFEFLPRGAVVKVYAVEDTGTGLVQLDFTLGTRVIGDSLPLSNALVGFGPDRNTDLLASGIGQAGERIQLRARNTTVTATPIRVLVEVIDI